MEPFRKLNGFKKCGKLRCLTCPYSTNAALHSSTFNKKSWPIHNQTSCSTKNCVYSISCSKCSNPNVQYEWPPWQLEKDSPNIGTSKSVVGRHYSSNSHSLSDIKFKVIEEVKNKNPFIIKARYSYWIQQYGGVQHLFKKEEWHSIVCTCFYQISNFNFG